MPNNPEIIEISYSANPPGQVGTKPRKIGRNSNFRFITRDPGILTIEFTGDSPLNNNAKRVNANADFSSSKPGRYPFKCTLENNGVNITLGDPSNPISVGGEIEVGC